MVSAPAHGTLALSANGSFTYTPNTNFNGNDSFTYKANDGQADSNIATVAITVNAVNDAPVAANDAYSINKGIKLTVAAPGVLSNDTDVDGDHLTATVANNVSNGSLTLKSDGSFTYMPNASFVGIDSFTYKANDGKADSNVATVSITVNAVNSAPVAVDDAYSTGKGIQLTVVAPGVLSNDTDVDGDHLTATVANNVSNGSLTLKSDGSFTYMPNASFVGIDSFTYKANDGKADSNVATVSITVNAVNSAPVAVDDAYSTGKGIQLTVVAPGVLSNDTDVDGDHLTATVANNVSNGSLTLKSDGSFTYTPNASFVGIDSFTYKANDGQADSNVATVSITISGSTTATFGLDNGSATYNESSNTLDAMRFQNTAGSGILSKLELLFDDTTPSGKVRLGVYADNSGVPGSLLLDAGEATVSDGWVSISSLSLPVTQNAYYWLVFNLQSAKGVRYQSGMPTNSHYWVKYTYGSLPGQYSLSGAGKNSNEYVMRATVIIDGP